jgi:hypothetical protein
MYELYRLRSSERKLWGVGCVEFRGKKSVWMYMHALGDISIYRRLFDSVELGAMLHESKLYPLPWVAIFPIQDEIYWIFRPAGDMILYTDMFIIPGAGLTA